MHDERSSLPLTRKERFFSDLQKYTEKVLQILRIRKEEETTNHSLKVTKVEQKLFQRLYDQLKNTSLKVSMGTWSEVEENEGILNKGAGPCLILYFHDTTNNEILSGHYSYTDVDDSDQVIRDQLEEAKRLFQEENPQGIAIPTTEEKRKMPHPLGDIVGNYEQLVEEVNARKKDGAEIEVYLFGQNYVLPRAGEMPEIKNYESFLADVILTWTRRRSAPVTDLQRIGMNLEDIHDFRPEISYEESQIDHTAYIPGKGIVYTRGDVLSN
jgi:hypothetical protein